MALSEELTRLDELRQRGVLSEEEFARAKARLLGEAPLGSPGGAAPVVDALNRLRRSRDDRWIGGVCGGLAVASGLDAWLWRLAFAILFFCGGVGLIAYLLLWIFVPSA